MRWLPARTANAPPWWSISMSHQRVGELHLGPLLSDDDRRFLLLRCHLRGVVRARRRTHRGRPGDPDHQPAAAPRARASGSLLRGPRLRGDPRVACPPHPALGRRRRHRTGQPRAALPLPPPTASPRRHHDKRRRQPPHCHRQRRRPDTRRVTGPPTDHTATRRRPLPGPTGERADWWWYEPFKPQPPPTTN